MGKSKQPRKPKGPAAVPKQEIVVHRAVAPPAVAPLLFQVVETLRLVAERMIDIADATAEAVTKRLAGRTLD